MFLQDNLHVKGSNNIASNYSELSILRTHVPKVHTIDNKWLVHVGEDGVSLCKIYDHFY